jgi:hypothetical protein
MRPLSPEAKRRVIESHPEAAPGEIESDLGEYERLVSAMFQRDPDAPRRPGTALAAPEPDQAQRRLADCMPSSLADRRVGTTGLPI